MEPLQITHGAYLPHWTRKGGIYHVTFRLADSLPASVLAAWEAERDIYIKRVTAHHGKLSPAETRRVDFLHSKRIQDYLDGGHGACLLRQPGAAPILHEVLLNFHGDRYDILAWCIMPNHVHVVVRPQGANTLPLILHRWKGYSARRINRLLERRGTLWRSESYDHLIRNDADLRHAVKYVLENPVKAGLAIWPWVGRDADG